MHYSYKSNGIVSRSLSDYRDNLLSDFSNFRIWEGDKEFTEGQYLTKRISDVNYGTVGDYGSESIVEVRDLVQVLISRWHLVVF